MNDLSGIVFLANTAVFHVIDVKYRRIAQQQVRIASEGPLLLFAIGRDIRVQTRELPWVVRAYGLFLIPPGGVTCIDAMRGAAEYYTIEFQADIPPNAGRRAVRLFVENPPFHAPQALLPDGGADLVARFRRIMEIWKVAGPEKGAGTLSEFYGILYETIRQARAPHQEARQDIVERTRRYLDQHFAESNSIQMLAEVVGVGRTTLYEQFHRATDISPQQYLTNLRLQAAQKALRETDLAVQDIAEACGFSNRNYFFQLFRKRTGTTPGEYRAAHRQEASRGSESAAAFAALTERDQGGRKLLISNFGRIHHYSTVPKRVVCLDYSTAEILAALGAAGSITGLAEAEESLEDCLPEARRALAGIPLLTQRSAESRVPSYEMIRSCQPELVVGTSYSFHAQSGVADAAQFERDGMHVYALKATYALNSTLEDVYEDIVNLGRILDREQEAARMIGRMRAEAEALADSVAQLEPPARVFVLDDVLGERLFTCGQSIENHLIARAGGRNIFGDISRQFALVEWGDVIAADPEVILVHSFYGAEDGAKKAAFLRKRQDLSAVSAVKHDRIFPLGIKRVFPGIGSVDTIRQMAHWFRAAQAKK